MLRHVPTSDPLKRPYGLDCVHITCGEAQVARGRKAIKDQLIPFDRVRYFDFKRPLCDAINEAVATSAYQWCVLVAGDIILNKDATHIIHQALELYRHKWGRALGVRIPIYDTFIERTLGGTTVLQAYVDSFFGHRNMINDDVDTQRRARVRGYKFFDIDKQSGVTIGTHFDKPDDFQIFKRFFSAGVKMILKRNKRFADYLNYQKSIKRSRQMELAHQCFIIGRNHRNVLQSSHDYLMWYELFLQYYERLKPLLRKETLYE
jgi:hypothetical protein